jgi:antitoxin component YwqK of YwqJK toxin-antitoxin module
MKSAMLSVLLVFCVAVGYSQEVETEDTDTIDLSIPQYDKLCSIMGGDSVRLNNGQKATGFFKDTYPSGRLKHKGYYDQGKIITVFTNYYENGQIERTFKAKTDRRGTLEVYYPTGGLLSRVEWIDGESLMWEDYYPKGQLEFSEEYNKGLDYYLYMRFYYEDGRPQILFELVDEKERIYSYNEYYPNGQVKESGSKMYNANLNDYPMEGKWVYYDENGKLTLEEEYTHGQLINDKRY